MEGDWRPDLTARTESVRSLLGLMEQAGRVRAVYRDIGTVEELKHYVAIWLDQKRYANHRFGWFAFHGSPGYLHIGRRRFSLEQLGEEVFGRGACAGKTIYFASCETIAVDEKELADFRALVGAPIVCGFTEKVDWLEAAAFELLLLKTLGDYQTRTADALKLIHREHGALADRLGFHSDPPWR